MSARGETIYAFATPPGVSGVAVLRISGKMATQALLAFGIHTPPAPRVATLVGLKNGATSEPLDQALLLSFPAPHSFTGEDVIELHLHGSRAVRQAVLQVLSRIEGLRPAEAGEFARRAFLNGKMDALQAEGLADLLAADSKTQLQQAWRQYRGDASATIEALRSDILRPLALLEAYLDFPEEDIPEQVLSEVAHKISELRVKLQKLGEDSGVGEKIREGLEIVILGPPNAGKSSFLNALAGREAAIVSAQAGTTRDFVEIQLEINGFLVTFVDTAGLRATENEIEEIGIERAKKRAEKADVRILLFDIDTNPKQYADILALANKDAVIFYTKADQGQSALSSPEGIAISSITGFGIEAALVLIGEKITQKMGSYESPLITRARHRRHLDNAASALARFSLDLPLELACEELRVAATSIGNFTGKIHNDELLDIIFREFCIGK